MVRYCYIVAEGIQDIEFLICLLKSYGLKRVIRFSVLDPFWKPLIPTNFLIDDDLVKRVPIPFFLRNSELSVALHSSRGVTRLSETVQESLAVISGSQIFGIGLVLDADDTQTPQKRFEELTAKLSLLDLPVPSVLGEVMRGSPRCGIFIMPNNADSGTLEDVLLECAKVNYPNLLALSTSYVTGIDINQLTQDDLKELKKPAGKNKAVVSSISGILKPGKSLQVSIQDNRWINEQTMVLNSVKLIKIFLDEVTGFA